MKFNRINLPNARLICLCLLIIGTISCEEFVNIDPPTTEITKETAFVNDATAKSTMAGLYSKIMENEYLFTSGLNSITTSTGLSGDELINFSNSPAQTNIYNNSLTGEETMSLWNNLFETIYQANAIIEGLQQATTITPTLNQQLTGESLFMRAFCNFYLVNLFGDVPIVTSTDYRINNQLARSPSVNVYQQIIADLLMAQTLMNADYELSKGERTRPNKSVAEALLARAYLYQEDWVNAEVWANKVINNTDFRLEPELNNTFLASSSEAIWQLQPVFPGYNTFDGSTYILTDKPNTVSLSQSQINGFESNDLRLSSWINTIDVSGDTYYYPYKYKVKVDFEVTEYLMVFRLAEQLLIRAEARARQNKLPEAMDDLSTIRTRAGLPAIAGLSQDQVLTSIIQERRSELFCEWGHRWFDLKRTNRINEVLAATKIGWAETDKLYPIPQTEISNNPNLLPRNPGY